MHLRRSLFACAVGLLLAAPLPAAEPALVIHAQSFDELLSRVKATVKSFVPDKLYQEFEKNALPELDPKKLPGVDSKRPIGLYASVDASILQGDFSKSQAVALIPVSSEKDFLAALEKIEVKATEQKEAGLYALQVPIPDPNVPPIFLRFAKQYAYVSIGSAGVDPKNMLDPKDVMPASEKAAAALRIYIERIPKEVKDFILAKLEEAGKAIAEQPLFPPELRDLPVKYMKFAVRMYKQGLEGGKELAYRFDIEPKTGLTLDATVTPLPNTELAKSIAGIPKSQNRFASLVGTDSAAHGFLSLPLYVPELRDIFVALAELGGKFAKEGLERDQAPKEAQEAAAEAFAALKRTFEAGVFDIAGSLRGPGRDGKFSTVGAVTIKDTAPLEKAVKAVVKIEPKVAQLVKLDAHKVGERSVHEIAVGDMMPMEMQAVFGKASVYVCFAPDALCVSFGTNGLDLIKEALNARSGPAPQFSAEVNGKRLAELVKLVAGKKADDPEAGMWLNLLTKQERLVLFSMDVEGGAQLRIKANYGVLPFMMVFYVGARANADFRPVPPVPVKP